MSETQIKLIIFWLLQQLMSDWIICNNVLLTDKTNTKGEAMWEGIQIWEILKSCLWNSQFMYCTIHVLIITHNFILFLVAHTFWGAYVFEYVYSNGNVFMLHLCETQDREDLTVILWRHICLPLEGGILKVNWVASH